jgi:hypothetical protein
MSVACVRVNDPYVVHESIDGEVIILNLETGTYYGLRDVGAEIWRFIQQRGSVDAIVEAIARRYSGARDAIEAAVRTFIEELRAETLVVLDSAGAAAQGADGVAAGMVLQAQLLPFTWPRFEKFTDLRYLLSS